jgi:glycosyltransferase involved in cell wall biosynthesis
MRIVVVTHYYSTHGGGIEIVAGILAEMFAAAHDVVWAASDCDAMPATIRASLRCVPMRSVNGVERLTGLPFPLWGPGSLVRLWREISDADVVHLHDFAYVGNGAAFLFATLRGKPILITQHVGFIPYRNAVLRAALRALHATVGRLILGRADRVVFISRVVRDYYARFVRYRREPLLVANGVDVRMFAPASAGDRERVRAAIGLDPQRPVCLFVGRFVEKKGVHILEALARRLPEVSWVFAGWGPFDPASWKLSNVHVFSDRRGAALVPLYQAANLLVLPSVGEGLPLVVQEAMSCGTPVMVGLDTADAIDAPSGLVFGCEVGGDGTVDRWEASLRRVLADVRALGERQRAIAEFAAARWSWDTCAATYLTLFEQLVQRAVDRHEVPLRRRTP